MFRIYGKNACVQVVGTIFAKLFCMNSISDNDISCKKTNPEPRDDTSLAKQKHQAGFSKEIDRLTKALKMALLRVEGTVDGVRSEFGANSSQNDCLQNNVQIAWISSLNAEIIVDEHVQDKDQSTQSLTQKETLSDTLNHIPSEYMNPAGFAPDGLCNALENLEQKLAELRRKIDAAVVWSKQLRGVDTVESPVFKNEILHEEKNPENGLKPGESQQTRKVSWDEVLKQVPADQITNPNSATKSAGDTDHRDVHNHHHNLEAEKARETGLQHLERKEYQSAENLLRPWVERAPDDAKLRYLYSRSLFCLGEFEQAALQLEKTIELNPDFASAYFVLGSMYVKSGQREKSIRAFERFLLLRPDDERSVAIRRRIEILKE